MADRAGHRDAFALKNIWSLFSVLEVVVRPEAMTKMARTAVRFKRVFGSYDSDTMPKALIAVSLGLAVVALGVGVALGWEGLVSNIAANLVILGPGLLITNMLVGAWREDRVARQIEPLTVFIINELASSLNAAREFAGEIGVSVDELEQFDGRGGLGIDDLISVRDALKNAADALKSRMEHEITVNIRVTPNLLKVADATLVERFVAHFSALRPASSALVLATMAAHLYENLPLRGFVDFSSEYPGDHSRMGDTQRGFANFRLAAQSNGVQYVNNKSPLFVQGDYYGNLLHGVMTLSVRIIEELYEVMPASVLERLAPVEAPAA